LSDAEGLFRKTVEGSPDHADALYHLGLIAHELGSNAAAIGFLRRAVAVKPDHAPAMRLLAVAETVRAGV
jgi:cytochrome c-type biogenesis protein CcmH/NrfG